MYTISRKGMLAAFAMTCTMTAFSQEPKRDGDPALTEVWLNEPAVVTPGTTAADAPSDAIVLFDGKDASKWVSKSGGKIDWKVDNGALTVGAGKGDITSKDAFGDMQMHIEWRTPSEVKGESQGRGNSGIFIMGLYELQVLDNYNNRTYSNGQAGSIYKQLIPLANACRKPGEWQTYDIVFTAPRFAENGMVKTPARITVIHNGVLVQNNATLVGATEYIGIPVYRKHADKLPIRLQDHGNPVSYRNIWVRNL